MQRWGQRPQAPRIAGTPRSLQEGPHWFHYRPCPCLSLAALSLNLLLRQEVRESRLPSALRSDSEDGGGCPSRVRSHRASKALTAQSEVAAWPVGLIAQLHAGRACCPHGPPQDLPARGAPCWTPPSNKWATPGDSRSSLQEVGCHGDNPALASTVPIPEPTLHRQPTCLVCEDQGARNQEKREP